MSSISTLLYTAVLVTGGIVVRRSDTWKVERTGWLMLFVSTGLLMSVVAWG